MHDVATAPLRVLLVEDSPGDVRLIENLFAHPENPRHELHVESRLDDATDWLAGASVDAVLLDLSLPDAQELESVEALRALRSEIAIVVLTGLDDDERAVKALQMGAQDYVVKGQANAVGLMRALRHAVERNRLEVERDRLFHQLQHALAQMKVLRGLLPICSGCKRIREEGEWIPVEVYIRNRSDADFTHAICPECFPRLYPELETEN